MRRHAVEAAAYFLEPNRLHSSAYLLRLLDIIKAPIGQPLLRQLGTCAPQLLALLKGRLKEDGSHARRCA